MIFRLSPKSRRNLARILPYGVIWLFLGWFILTLEFLATGNENQRPETEITLSFGVLVFASLAVFIAGLLMGVLEVFVFKNLFRSKGLGAKIALKMGIYLLFMLILNALTFPLAASLELGTTLTDEKVWEKFWRYLGSVTFWSTLISLSFHILLSLIYSGISDHLGHGVLLNLFTGRYHRPLGESRIFMFLDMQSSTSLAEKLGHQRYFDFLSSYYNELSDAIVEHEGSVYQYIGDEIVITWETEKGLRNGQCVACFFAMRKQLESKARYFEEVYGVIPAFRAGLHCGQVTTGEIGALKKEIFFTGDVLNVTSRIQKLCKIYGKELITTQVLKDQLPQAMADQAQSLGDLELEGRAEKIELFSLA